MTVSLADLANVAQIICVVVILGGLAQSFMARIAQSRAAERANTPATPGRPYVFPIGLFVLLIIEVALCSVVLWVFDKDKASLTRTDVLQGAMDMTIMVFTCLGLMATPFVYIRNKERFATQAADDSRFADLEAKFTALAIAAPAVQGEAKTGRKARDSN